MNLRSRMKRRGFLALCGAVAAPMILPSGVFGAKGRPGASERIVLGLIGVGERGRTHLEALRGRVAAVCDVDGDHLAGAVKMLDGKPRAYRDYRDLLEQEDIDAVVIATPDHWHGLQTVHACEAGKDVYVEKPAARTVREGQAMVQAARRFARVVQVGSQDRSTVAVQAACAYIRNGRLGRVERVRCWDRENPVGGDPSKNGPPPASLDWDSWVGPARWVPYNPDRCHVNFRWLMDFGGGYIRDHGAHVFNVVSWCLGLDGTGPVEVKATGAAPGEGLWDCPTTLNVTYRFKNPELTIHWAQPGERALDAEFGAEFHGAEGALVVAKGGDACDTEEKAMTYAPPKEGPKPFGVRGHYENWFDCIKTRERPVMDVEAGHRVASLCILGNLAYTLGRTLEWDPAAECVVGDEQANRLLAAPVRGPWHF